MPLDSPRAPAPTDGPSSDSLVRDGQCISPPTPVAGPGDLEGADLSPWFNPFLSHYASEARRCGGTAELVRGVTGVEGLWVADGVERIGTIFSRSHALAERFVRDRGDLGVFADYLLSPNAEVFDIFRASLAPVRPTRRYRNVLRAVRPSDLPALCALLGEVCGPVNGRWFESVPWRTDSGFLAEVDGRLAGVGWVTVVRDHARLHSLTVRPPYRRMGIGTDLVAARLDLARRAGAKDVLSEISRGNVVSRRIALAVGFERVGEMYFHPPLAAAARSFRSVPGGPTERTVLDRRVD